MNGTDGAQLKAKELVAEFPDKYFYPDQYNNENNWKAHFDTTAPEIWPPDKRAQSRIFSPVSERPELSSAHRAV